MSTTSSNPNLCPHGKPLTILCQLCVLGLPPFGGQAAAEPPPRCRFLGRQLSGRERAAAGLSHRDWRECGHPSQPLGTHVCLCQGCDPGCWGYAAGGGEKEDSSLLWACGLTCVPERFDSLLPRTLASLRLAGFPPPRLFLDGAGHAAAAEAERRFSVQVTTRSPRVRAYANWLLGLEEVYLREPQADRYAMFQDDFAACVNLRAYLERCPFPKQGYLNLFTFPENEKRAKREGFFLSNQQGKGAVALIFCNEGARLLLQHRHIIDRPHDPAPEKEPERPFKAIDGAVVSAMKKAGYAEWVHSPSLVQHLGERSTLGNAPHPQAESYRGELFDALSLLRESR